VALYYPATVYAVLASIGFVLLLTPTGSLPGGSGWRWWVWVAVAALVVLLLLVPFAPGRFEPRYLVVGGPLDFRAFGGLLLATNQAALAVTLLAVVVGAGSLVVRFRRACEVVRQQLRWVAFAAAVMGAGMLALAALMVAGEEALVAWVAVVCVAILPLAIGAAILRYRLYDLDRIISRTLTYGLLTAVLGLCYVAGSLLFVLGACRCGIDKRLSMRRRCWW
jgi:MFS family permease